jgi:hypothetical protein
MAGILTSSIIWHFHRLNNGRIFLVSPNKATRLCKEEGRCALIQVDQMQVLNDFRLGDHVDPRP